MVFRGEGEFCCSGGGWEFPFFFFFKQKRVRCFMGTFYSFLFVPFYSEIGEVSEGAVFFLKKEIGP